MALSTARWVSWRWTLLPAPVAAIVLAAAARVIPRGARPDRAGRRFDVPGAVTVTVAMLLLVYAVIAGVAAAGVAAGLTGMRLTLPRPGLRPAPVAGVEDSGEAELERPAAELAVRPGR
ncbi:MAG: hypothetical protein ACM3ML_00405 [Micromonosporaceae bacterium]